MAFTFVASQQGTDSGSGTTLDASTGALTVLAGDVLVAWVKHEGTSTTLAVADSGGGNTFTFDAGDKTSHSNGDLHTSFGYLLSASADATFVGRLTLGAARTFRTIQVWQFRPDSGETVTKDASNDAQGSSGTMNSGNITTTGGDEVVLGGYGEYIGRSPETPQIGGVAADGSLLAAAVDGECFSASWYRILTGTMTNGAATCTNNSSDWTCAVIAIKSETAGVDEEEALTGSAASSSSGTAVPGIAVPL